MGIVVYTLQTAKTKSIIVGGVKKRLALYKSLCMLQDLQRCQEDYQSVKSFLSPLHTYVDKACRRAENFDADLFVMTDSDLDGHTAYDYREAGAKTDSHEYDTPRGIVISLNGKLHLIPEGTSVNDFVSSVSLKLYNKMLPYTQVYVKINDSYTATVRNIENFKNYVYGFGKDSVDLSKLAIISKGDSPVWFQLCVSEIIDNLKK